MVSSLDAGTPPPAAPPFLLDAVLALDVALERRLLYPDAHPFVRASREAYARAWAATLEALGATRLWIGPGKIGWGTSEFSELSGPRVEALGRLLHSLHVTSITVDVEAQGEDVLALLDLVHSLRTDPRPFQSIQRWVKDSGIRAVHVSALDMDDLRYTEHREDAPPDQMSSGLHRYLTGPEEDPVRVANELMEKWKGQEMLGLAAVRAELLQRLERVKPGEERELSERIVRLLAALPEAVRADLLKIRTPSGSSMLARIVRPLPPRDALTTLLELGQVKGALPKGTTAIITQILHCLPDGQEVAEQIAAPGEDEVDSAKVAAALEAMFANRADQDYNPEDYQDRLDELARQENLAVGRSAERTAILEDAVGLAAQTVAIAAMTLADAAPGEDRALLERLDRSLPLLLDRKRTNVVAVAARAMRARGAGKAGPGAAFVAHLSKNVEKLLAPGTRTPNERDDLRAVLALVPSDLVGREAMRLLVAGGPDQDAEFLRSLLQDVDGRVLAALLTETVEKSPERVGRVRSLLRDARSLEVRKLLGRLQQHPDRRVRTTALAVLVERDGASRHVDALTEAVAGPDLELARWALQCLATSTAQADDVTEFLGSTLETQRGLPPEVSARIATTLLQRGGAGVRRAAAAAMVLCRSTRPKAVRLTRVLIAGLEEHADDPDVQRAIQRWRRSPARWLSWLLSWRERER